MSELRQHLAGFLMHEGTPVDSILGHHTLEKVFQEIHSILSDGEPKSIVHTLGFIRDANLYGHPFRQAFQQCLAESKIWEALQHLLQAPDFGVRRSAIHTVGKLGNRDRAYLLSDAFPFYLENDPINIRRLLLELLWLTNDWNWGFVQRVAAADHYLVRWSLCQVLDDSGSSTEILRRFLGILAKLKLDVHPLVAAEASLRFERVHVKLGPRLERSEWRKEVQRIATLQPKVIFESAAMQFMRDRSDYCLDDFDRFISKEG